MVAHFVSESESKFCPPALNFAQPAQLPKTRSQTAAQRQRIATSQDAEALDFQTQTVLHRPPALNDGSAAAKNTRPRGQDEAVRGQATMPRGQANRSRGQTNRSRGQTNRSRGQKNRLGVKKTGSGVKKTGCPKVMDYMKNGETSKMDPTYTPSICSIFSKSPMEVDGLM
jgi:hypothetical protein